MANFATPAMKVTKSSVAALRYLSALPRTINRDAESGYEAGYGSTVNVPMPVKATAATRTKAQRAARNAINYTDLTRQYVPVELADQIYSAVRLPSDWYTWTLQSFEDEVAKPTAEAVVDELPKKLAALMTAIKASQAADASAAAVDYTDAKALKLKSDSSNVLEVVARLARVLNSREVPTSDRTIAVGPGVAEVIQKNRDLASAAYQADDGDSLHEAIISRLKGFTIIEDPRLPEKFGIAYQRDAFTMALRAATVPLGASYGANHAEDGFALRLICDYDPDQAEDRAVVDAFFGAAIMDAQRATAFGLA